MFQIYIRVNKGVTYTINVIRPLIFPYPIGKYLPLLHTDQIPHSLRYLDWHHLSLLLTYIPDILHKLDFSTLHHSKSQFDWCSLVSETNISLQNWSPCIHWNEIICNNYMKRILSETNNPSEIIWHKRSISKHLPSMVTATWMVNGARTHRIVRFS